MNIKMKGLLLNPWVVFLFQKKKKAGWGEPSFETLFWIDLVTDIEFLELSVLFHNFLPAFLSEQYESKCPKLLVSAASTTV